MAALHPGRRYTARVADVRPGGRLALYVGDALHTLAAPPAALDGLAPGSLVAVTVDAAGGTAVLEPLGGGAGLRPGGDALRWRRGVGPGGTGPTRMAVLGHRAAVLRGIRSWCADEGLQEADTPALVRAPSPEAVFAPVPAGHDWLITSPEFQLKRLLVGGWERVYRLGPVFRGDEAGVHHNPEFTLLEWYRVGVGLEALAADLESLLERLAPVATACAGEWDDPEVAGRLHALAAELARHAWRRATVCELLAEHLGLEATGITTAPALRDAARRAGLADAGALPSDDFAAAFSALWVRVEERLGPEPLLVTEWPAPTASLARLKPNDSTVAERMELYAGGLELANGFAELTDPVEQRRRFQADLAERRAKGLAAVPLDEAFLAALAEGMPPAAGMALGVERLVMLLTGAPHIRAVLPFAWDER